MKCSDLQIGDYVLAKPSMMLIKVDAVHHKKVGYHAVTNKLNWVRMGLLEPVPLTEDILKLNGFVLDIRNGRYYCHVNGDDVWVRLPKEYAMYPYVDIIYSSLVHCPEDVTEVSHSNEVQFPEKAYVHQFQQVLRICGLNDLADNLKLEE